jgi:hypothetical protein
MRAKKQVTNNFLDPKNCNRRKCKSCIFRTDGKQLKLSPEREAEIRAYLARGENSHICHQTEKTCYGGLEYQSTIFYRMGFIKEESVSCLLETANKFIDGNSSKKDQSPRNRKENEN